MHHIVVFLCVILVVLFHMDGNSYSNLVFENLIVKQLFLQLVIMLMKLDKKFPQKNKKESR